MEGVLEDAKVDFDHLEKDYNSIEKERNNLLQHNTQLVSIILWDINMKGKAGKVKW